MIPKLASLCLFAAAALLDAAIVRGDTLTVRVMDEQNRGVHSRVLHRIAADPSVLGDTDTQGNLTRSYQCASGVLIARPFDIGSYFESRDQPCNADVTLRVIRRQTPKGLAIQFRLEDTLLADGSHGFVTYKGLLETKITEISNNKCEVRVGALVEQTAFKAQGTPLSKDAGTWTELGRRYVDPHKIFIYDRAKVGNWEQVKTVVFPYDCTASSSRIQGVRTEAARDLSYILDTSSIPADSIRELMGVR